MTTATGPENGNPIEAENADAAQHEFDDLRAANVGDRVRLGGSERLVVGEDDECPEEPHLHKDGLDFSESIKEEYQQTFSDFINGLVMDANRDLDLKQELQTLSADEAMEQAVLNWRMSQSILKTIRDANNAGIKAINDDGFRGYDEEISIAMEMQHDLAIAALQGHQRQTELSLQLHDRLVAAKTALA